MERKCSVYGCKSGYATSKSDTDISKFRFPKDIYQRKLWFLALPNGGLIVDNITDQKNNGCMFKAVSVDIIPSAR